MELIRDFALDKVHFLNERARYLFEDAHQNIRDVLYTSDAHKDDKKYSKAKSPQMYTSPFSMVSTTQAIQKMTGIEDNKAYSKMLRVSQKQLDRDVDPEVLETLE